MGSRNQNLRAQWTNESLENALQAIRAGCSVASAARTHGIPRKTLGDWVKRGNVPPCRRLGRLPTLPVEIEKLLRVRIVRLQQVGFGLTRRLMCKKAYEICSEMNIKNPFKNEMAGRHWLKGFLKRNPDIVFHKPENLSYGRLMKFNKEVVKHFFLMFWYLCMMNTILVHSLFTTVLRVDSS